MIALLSDIHGNLPALKAVLDDLPPVSAIWVMGDLIGELPYPCEVLDLLMKRCAVVVAGNNDLVMLDYRNGKYPNWRIGTQFGSIAWTADRLKPHHWAFLKALPYPLRIDTIYGGAVLAHGSPDNPRGVIRFAEHAAPVLQALPQQIFVWGHIHRARLFQKYGKMAINPGSVGLSLDGIAGTASYALLDENTRQVCFRHVGYDTQPVIDAMKERGLLEASGGYGEAVILELIHGRYYIFGLIEFAKAYAEKATGSKVDDIPQALWHEAVGLWNRQEWLPGRSL